MNETKGYKEPFMPIDPDYTEIIEQYILKQKKGKVHFFDSQGQINSTLEGLATSLDKKSNGIYLVISDNQSVRVDRIITLMGRPGPAYDEYDRYANACLTCENLGQF